MESSLRGDEGRRPMTWVGQMDNSMPPYYGRSFLGATRGMLREHVEQLEAANRDLRARLAAMEAARDRWRTRVGEAWQCAADERELRKAAEGRLAAVEALFVAHNSAIGCFKDACVCLGCQMAAVARGDAGPTCTTAD